MIRYFQKKKQSEAIGSDLFALSTGTGTVPSWNAALYVHPPCCADNSPLTWPREKGIILASLHVCHQPTHTAPGPDSSTSWITLLKGCFARQQLVAISGSADRCETSVGGCTPSCFSLFLFNYTFSYATFPFSTSTSLVSPWYFPAYHSLRPRSPSKTSLCTVCFSISAFHH